MNPEHPSRTTDTLGPYLPRLVIEWLEDAPQTRARTINGTAVFADISGFTNLTERLARKGRVGAEEMGDTLNLIFDALLGAAYDLGAGLVKWGGDAVLLLFDGDDHVVRAAAAAQAMQRVIDRVGRVRTSAGDVRLRMSIGMHSGDLDFLLVGDRFRELIVTGPGASAVARMETAAEAGEVVVSSPAAEPIVAAGGTIGPARGDGFLLTAAPHVQAVDLVTRAPTSLDLTAALPRPLVEHLLAADVAYEHRAVAVCFVEFSGVDTLRTERGLDAVSKAVEAVISACQRAADDHEVMFLSTDIYPDGGKVILVAGAPRNTGDDATRVLTAARQILDSDQVLSVRAGVNVGRVFAGDYGPAYRRVYSITGDCVNLAARLMAKAGPGQLVASAAALAASRTSFATEVLAPFAVKGKSELIEASVVGPPTDTSHTHTRPVMPLIGRSKELALLLRAWIRAEGRDGSLVELIGEPGVGKSRLLQELVEVAEVRPLWLDGNIYATQTPFEPFHRLFADRVAIDRAAPDAAEQLRAIVEEVDPATLPWLPLVGIVAGIRVPETPEVRQLDGAARKERLEKATSSVLGHLLPDPTLLVFNDVDFMDDASTDLLDRLAADAVDRPWLIVASRRPTAVWRPHVGVHLTTVELSPLPPEAADELLATALSGGALPPHRMAELVERSGGNPLFITELAAGFGAGSDAESVPDTVEGVIGARIDRLSPPARSLLRAASVLGVRVDRDLLAALVQRSPGLPNLSVLDTLTDVLVPAGDDLLFAHNLVRETAYAGLPFRYRRELHGTAADILMSSGLTAATQPALLSLHCFHAERYDEALEFSTRAAELAKEQYANSEAAENYRRAISAGRKLPPARRDRRRIGELWFSACWVYEDLGDLDAMADAVAQAHRLLRGDPLDVAKVAEMTSVHRRLAGDYPGSLRWLGKGIHALEGLQTSEARQLRGLLFERYARIRLSQGRLRDAVRWADQAVGESRAAGDPRGEALALETRSVAQSNSGVIVDLDEAARAVELWAAENDLNRVARIHNVVGVLALNQGEWVRALVHYRASTEAYERLGRPIYVGLLLANQAEIMIFQGFLDEAEELLAVATKLLRGATGTTEYGFAVGQQGRIAMARGDVTEAIQIYSEARRIQEEVGDQYEVVILDALIAEAHQLLGNGALALAGLEDVRSRNRSVGATLDYLGRVEGLAQILCDQRDLGLVTLRAAVATAIEQRSAYDEWRLLAAFVELGAAGRSDLEALASLRPILLERLGMAKHLVDQVEQAAARLAGTNL